MRPNDIIVHSSHKLKKMFYSTDHCQAVIRTWHNPDGTVDGEEKAWLGTDDWVPTTSTLPLSVAPRPSLPDGIVKTRAEYKMIFYPEYEIIPNPEPEYQA